MGAYFVVWLYVQLYLFASKCPDPVVRKQKGYDVSWVTFLEKQVVCDAMRGGSYLINILAVSVVPLRI